MPLLYFNFDWLSNFNIRATKMDTPELIRDKMEGVLQNRILVHSGFYNYLFENSRLDGDERFESIVSDITKVIGGEEGYSVYVTGHRYVRCIGWYSR